MFGTFGATELIIVLVIILLLFGAKKVPELARGLGTGVREFRKGTSEDYEVEEEKKENQELDSSDEEKDKLEKDATVEAEHQEQRRG